MKKVFLVLCLISLFTGCKSEEKVNVIKGAGMANSSLMVSFNELCKGSVEGFLGKDENLLIYRKSGSTYSYHIIDTKSGTDTLMFTSDSAYKEYTEISPDGNKVIINDLLFDRIRREQTHLPDGMDKVPGNTDPQPLPSYMFTKDSELLMINPMIYIKKYKKMITSISKDIELPDLTAIGSLKVLPRQLKCVFTGKSSASSGMSLYTFDLYSKEFLLVDDNILDFSISPTEDSIAYIRKNSDEESGHELHITGLDDNKKRKIATQGKISGMEWSPNGNWIAYSGGKGQESDVWIVKRDGVLNEQLTQSMFSTGKLDWSSSGKLLAFTSDAYAKSENQSVSDSTVYTVTLNIDDPENIPKTAGQGPERVLLEKELIKILREETAAILGKQ
ncbi:MAG: hypothetical protein N3I35_06940 [Clostridia bacterium]|nr:hypothetical protein [Clostridia bacterium]